MYEAGKGKGGEPLGKEFIRGMQSKPMQANIPSQFAARL